MIDSVYVLLRGGHLDYALLDAPIVDRYGNINTTCIGDYRAPRVRMAGSGGATEIAAFCRLIIVSGAASKERFPERVDYISTPGYLEGYDSRLKAGYKPGTGPQVMVCPLGRFTFHPVSKELVLDACHPGSSIESVQAHFVWPLQVSPQVRELPAPTPEELRVVREEIEGARRRYYRVP
jgi:glutaconate CoA-transferase subunit B